MCEFCKTPVPLDHVTQMECNSVQWQQVTQANTKCGEMLVVGLAVGGAAV